MADLTLAKNAALRKMLQALFPNVALSSAGVALLATQIDGLEKNARGCAVASTMTSMGSIRLELTERPQEETSLQQLRLT